MKNNPMQDIKFTSLLTSLAVMAACSNDSSAPPLDAGGPSPASTGIFNSQISHASPDAPAVRLSVASAQTNTQILTNETEQKDGPPAAGDVANLTQSVLNQYNTPVPADYARLRVLHAAPLAPQVYVYATAPGADLAASPPIGSFPFGEGPGPIEAPADDCRVHVTLPDNPDAVVFNSGTVTLADGSELLVAAVENTTTGHSPISLVARIGAGTVEVLDVDAPAHLLVVHAAA